MTYLLIVQMMIFSPMGDVIRTSTIQSHYESMVQCEAALSQRMRDWQRAHASSSHVGIIARCVEPSVERKS